MIVAGIGWIFGEMCGSVRRGWQEEFKDSDTLYRQLETSGVFNTPLRKVRWFCDVSQRFSLASALALRDAFDLAGQIALDPAKIGMLGLSRDGALKANVEYFKDYIQSGRKSARGNLFIRTLPTSPLAQVAMIFGFKGPIFHMSTQQPRMAALIERGNAFGRRAENMNLLCCVSSEKGVISFFLKPELGTKREGLYSTAELNTLIGHLWKLEEVLEALKVSVGIKL